MKSQNSEQITKERNQNIDGSQTVSHSCDFIVPKYPYYHMYIAHLSTFK